MSIIKRNLATIEVLNVAYWYNQLTDEKKDAMGMKLRWALKKAVDKLLPEVKDFEEFRQKEFTAIRDLYFTDDKTEEIIGPKLDENGNVVKDENGNEETEPQKKLKPEYQKDFEKEVEELNKKLQDIASERNDYSWNSFDVDKFVESLPDDTPLTFDDVNLIDALLSDNGEV